MPTLRTKKRIPRGKKTPLGDQKHPVLLRDAVAMPYHAGAKLVEHGRRVIRRRRISAAPIIRSRRVRRPSGLPSIADIELHRREPALRARSRHHHLIGAQQGLCLRKTDSVCQDCPGKKHDHQISERPPNPSAEGREEIGDKCLPCGSRHSVPLSFRVWNNQSQ
jgi:hypothetical protein